ncbi:MAG: helicase-exonuclease AddAB subunit AddB [Planctomycetes bacterium]|nr:helicase-exonuclease AddAB subunit AddB [Planctomycetota bacterium]
MRTRFILGRAGTGKTHYCLNAIREELKRSQAGPPLLFLVPEQATFEMGRALLREGDLPGYSRAHVLSFRRLAYHVFSEVGGPALPPAGNLAKEMILARILADLKKGKELKVFGASAAKPGMAETLTPVITELHRYRCGSEQIEEQIVALEEQGNGDSILCLKLKDILLIHDAYHAWLRKSGIYSDPDDFLDLLADKLPSSAFVRGAHVWVDGFAGFTPQELRVLEKLIAQSGEFEIALCLDPAALDALPDSPQDLRATRLFHQTEETYLHVRGICRNAGREIEQIKLPRTGQPTRFDGRPALAHLERQVFHVAPKARKGRPEEITLAEAATPRAEVDAAARMVLSLCKEQNYRYRDIAVILRDFSGYHELVSAYFVEHGIPYFIDRRREVTQHPLIEMIRSAVRVAAENWPSDAVIQFLKTDLARIPRPDVDYLENYVLEHGIEGTRWYDDAEWRYRRTRDIEESPEYKKGDVKTVEINRIRRAATQVLRTFHERVAGKEHSVREMTQALFDLLEDVHAAEQIDQWRAAAETAERLNEAAEHGQVWNGLLTLLDELVKVLGDEAMSIADYADILDAGLEGMTLGLVPPALDQVLVGSIDRSRHPDLRAALVIGVGEQILPRVRSQDPIFTDRERDALAAAGLHLGPTSEEQLYRERFLGYIAFTRPRNFLWVSYPASDDSGKKRNPSIFVEQLRRCLPDIETVKLEAMGPCRKLDAVWSESQLASAVALTFRRGAEGAGDWRAAYNEILTGGEHPAAARVLGSLFYSNAAQKLPAKATARLYPDNTLIGSASQFETYRACPFKYFARYVLGLEARELFDLSALDLGSFYHGVLDRVFGWIIKNGIDLAEVDAKKVMKQVDEAIDALAPNLKSEILLSDGRSEFVKSDSRRLLKDLVSVMRLQAGDTDFKPAACELSFGGRDSDLPPLEMRAGGKAKVRIRGRIDRVDLAVSGGSKLVRVTDYKSTGRSLPLYVLVPGLHLQLPTYLIALRQKGQGKFGKGIVPAAAFLQPIRPEGATAMPLEGMADVPPLGEQPARFKARGFFDEQFAEVLDHAAEPGGYSRHFSFQILKSRKGFRKDGDQLPAGLLDALLDLAERHIMDIAEHVLAGDVPITPYRMGTETPCALCDYKGVCRFDAVHNRYRDIPKTSKEELTARLAEGADGIWQKVNQKRSE